MKQRLRRFGALVTAGAMLLQFAGCAPGLSENVDVFVRDFAREALAAFLF